MQTKLNQLEQELSKLTQNSTDENQENSSKIPKNQEQA